MPDFNLNLRPIDPSASNPSSSSSSSSPSKPILSSSLLKPWQFSYTPSPDGKDLNLLILFHGLGDTKEPFTNLGKQLNLPSTAILSLQAPDPIPLLEDPSFSWYNTFTPLFEPLPNPNPSPTVQKLRSLISILISPEIGWKTPQIHLFGFGQGGTVALELSLSIGQKPILPPSTTSSDIPSQSLGPTSNANTAIEGKRFGSVVSICATLLSHPTSSYDFETPIAMFIRQDKRSQAGQKFLAPVQRAFKKVEIVQAKASQGNLESMPRGKEEWQGVMKFWGEVLGRDEGWKGDGEVYEVVR